MGSRLLPLGLATAALGAGTVGLPGFALWLGLLAVPAAAAAAFVAVSDALEGRPTLLRAVTSGLALTLLVLGSAARENAPAGGSVPRLATWSLVLALCVYGVPAVAWLLEPLKVSRARPERRRRAVETPEILERAA